MSELLNEYIKNMDYTEALDKTASLEEVYGDDEIIRGLYNDANAILQEKIASGDIAPMSASTLVTMSARLADEAYTHLQKMAAAEEAGQEAEEMTAVIAGVLKEAGIDLNEVIATGDEQLITDTADLAAELIADIAEEEEEEYEE